MLVVIEAYAPYSMKEARGDDSMTRSSVLSESTTVAGRTSFVPRSDTILPTNAGGAEPEPTADAASRADTRGFNPAAHSGVIGND